MEPQKNRISFSTIINYGVPLFFVISLTLLHLFYRYVEHSDSLDNYSIILNYLQNGKICFPAYGNFDTVINHPPYFYYIMGWFSKMGLNSFFALILPHLLLNYFIVFLVWTASFNLKSKLAFTIPLIVPFMVFYTFAIRPDYLLALMAYAGLILLEISRLKKQSLATWYLGITLLSLASLMHPYGAFCFLAVLPYVAAYGFRCRQAGEPYNKQRVLFSLAIPIAIIGFHLLFYVLPNFNEVVGQISGKQSDFSFREAIGWHYYSYFTFLPYPFFLLLTFFIPTWLYTVLVCFYLKQYRTLSVALLPVHIFLFFFSMRQTFQYLYPELMWGTFALILFAFHIWHQPLQTKLKKAARYVFSSLLLLMGVACIIVLAGFKISRYPYNNWQHGTEMHLIRSCAQEIINPQSKIAGGLSPWYISGAYRWNRTDNNSLSNDYVNDSALRQRLKQFDYLVENSNGSNGGGNRFNKSFLNWHLDSMLHVKGFYINDFTRFVSVNQESNLVFYKTDTLSPNEKIRGFYCDNYKTLYQFDQVDTSSAAFFFCSFKVDSNDVSNYIDSSYCAVSMQLPDEAKNEFHSSLNMVYGVYTPEQAQALHLFTNPIITIRDYVPLSRKEISISELIQKHITERTVEVLP